jgi:hypothetical protein
VYGGAWVSLASSKHVVPFPSRDVAPSALTDVNLRLTTEVRLPAGVIVVSCFLTHLCHGCRCPGSWLQVARTHDQRRRVPPTQRKHAHPGKQSTPQALQVPRTMSHSCSCASLCRPVLRDVGAAAAPLGLCYRRRADHRRRTTGATALPATTTCKFDQRLFCTLCVL